MTGVKSAHGGNKSNLKAVAPGLCKLLLQCFCCAENDHLV
jgi:hypothetical protein